MGYSKNTLQILPRQVLIGSDGEDEIRSTARERRYTVEDHWSLFLVRDRLGDVKGGGRWKANYNYKDSFVGYIHQ